MHFITKDLDFIRDEIEIDESTIKINSTPYLLKNISHVSIEKTKNELTLYLSIIFVIIAVIFSIFAYYTTAIVFVILGGTAFCMDHHPRYTLVFKMSGKDENILISKNKTYVYDIKKSVEQALS
ncbi:MAG: DUF6232 family protein [Zymomonas mobilis subsp. pomaceae]|uniref:Uncharacterized protein n=1 Tax=Zymomonas mobilis subsp. pomaceae (strain ATCC 29192 / DSM 22645 / JCM 10191 / CCUG 17912 / NBRC 13757 / NCIMB 11200 / NRRL B-4491 / Barker I) TaxID=579138 RepID=F8EVI8_ZYMMT|nr:DUF6232 family protein [Zymomonas mobilis]AEI38325.1 hypothetical protein Zymop_1435 [Zymomonas mobilis subsp. pomaceae ATCC 29192]MDX5948014.1 DUF6232 family protein [Zymomonas mobilis subsp. pomaceae]GEB89344.1 hypothetical protein ZMO02_09810 [Zymomonas mobilis subsp. pomaceae]